MWTFYWHILFTVILVRQCFQEVHVFLKRLLPNFFTLIFKLMLTIIITELL